MEVPLNHPFWQGFPLQHNPSCWGTTILGNHPFQQGFSITTQSMLEHHHFRKPSILVGFSITTQSMLGYHHFRKPCLLLLFSIINTIHVGAPPFQETIHFSRVFQYNTIHVGAPPFQETPICVQGSHQYDFVTLNIITQLSHLWTLSTRLWSARLLLGAL